MREYQVGERQSQLQVDEQTCEDEPVASLFGGNRRQRACWWWSRARREVVVCHVGLVVDGSGHCVELKLKLERGGNGSCW